MLEIQFEVGNLFQENFQGNILIFGIIFSCQIALHPIQGSSGEQEMSDMLICAAYNWKTRRSQCPNPGIIIRVVREMDVPNLISQQVVKKRVQHQGISLKIQNQIRNQREMSHVINPNISQPFGKWNIVQPGVITNISRKSIANKLFETIF